MVVNRKTTLLSIARNGGNPWDRLPHETDKAWNAFKLFRDLGPDRNMVTVSEETGSGYGTVQRWKSKYDWEQRVRSYEVSLDRVRQKATARQVETMASRQAKLGRSMQQLAGTRVDEFINSSDLRSTMSVADATRLAAEGTRIERVAEGESIGDQAGQQIIINIGSMRTVPRWAPAGLFAAVPSDSTPASIPSIEGEVIEDATDADTVDDSPASRD